MSKIQENHQNNNQKSKFENAESELKWLIETQSHPIISEDIEDFMVCDEIEMVKFREDIQAFNIFIEGFEVVVLSRKK